MARLRASHSYGFVLLLVVVSFVFTASAPSGDWSRGVLILLQAATLVVALWTSGLGRHAVLPSIGLAALAVAGAAVQLTGGERAGGVIALLAGLLVLTTGTVIVVGVVDQREVNPQSLLGAISIYLLLGMFFVFVYGSIAALGSGDFFAQGTDGTQSERLYFSYITLTTVGYGDFTAAATLGQTLAVVEALLGQLYLVTVVAVVIGRLSRREKHRPAGRD